jgi:small-conductance mechanosensitive channel
LARTLLARREKARIQFWTRQAIQLFLAIILIVGFLSIWFDDPGRLSTGLGLVTAGLAFALQKVVASLAGYLIILRGKTFNVGDRITMGGVRGDVISLGFMQTTILEMGQPPAVQNADPAMWVKARQYSGRIVTVSNSKIFDEPIYNYSREFPYLWEEMMVPIPFKANRKEAESILLGSAERHTVDIAQIGVEDARELERRYLVRIGELKPRVFLRITDNWIELTVRFIVRDHEIREVKDAMSREILDRFENAGIDIASATFEVVGIPPIMVEREIGLIPAKAS